MNNSQKICCGLIIGAILTIIFIPFWSPPSPKPECVHGWSKWVDHPRGEVNLRGKMFQQRYCTNCGWHQGENH